MSRYFLTLFLFNIFLSSVATDEASKSLTTVLQKNLEDRFVQSIDDIVNWLKNNDYINNSDIEIKKRLNDMNEGRGKKLLPIVLIPIVFQIGMMYTWMLMTTFLAAKSVAIGLLLLIFKIGASSAKLASIFTFAKVKKHGEIPLTVHHEFHGHHGHFDHHDHVEHIDHLEHFDHGAHHDHHGHDHHGHDHHGHDHHEHHVYHGQPHEFRNHGSHEYRSQGPHEYHIPSPPEYVQQGPSEFHERHGTQIDNHREQIVPPERATHQELYITVPPKYSMVEAISSIKKKNRIL